MPLELKDIQPLTKDFSVKTPRLYKDLSNESLLCLYEGFLKLNNLSHTEFMSLMNEAMSRVLSGIFDDCKISFITIAERITGIGESRKK